MYLYIYRLTCYHGICPIPCGKWAGILKGFAAKVLGKSMGTAWNKEENGN